MPKTLKIDGHTFEIRFKDEDEFNQSIGRIVHHKGIILIGTGMPRSMQIETLLHEALHHLNICRGFPLGKGDAEEGNIDAVACGLTQLLLDNNLLNFDNLPLEK